MGTTPPRRVLIIGGGIGGLTAAIALRRAGIQATVFERAAELRELQLGAGLNIWTNAIRALRRLGLDEPVVAEGSPLEWSEHRDLRGNVYARWPIGELGRKYGAPTVSIGRDSLHGVLASALGPDTVRFGATVEGFEQDARGVRLRLAGGREAHGEVLIGADGLRSVIRAQLLGRTAPRYAGYVTWRGVIEADFSPPGVDGGFNMVWGAGERFGYYRIDARRLYWFGIANAPPGQRDPPGGKRDAVLARFGAWPEPIPTFIATTPEQAIHRTDIYERPPARRWGAGRVTLLGDAAHPMSFNVGQGACTAIEDALVLAKCLTHQDDPTAALREYEAARIARTTPLVKRAHRLGSMSSWRNPLAIALRNQIMRLTFPEIAFKAQEADLGFTV
ncbi:MAG: FAD-dependent monooxygenase [Archangium sp.]